MLCAIYKSLKKEQTYLYLRRKHEFTSLPPSLTQVFGKPQFVTMIKLTPERRLANANTEKVLSELADKGFYLQLPPPEESLLKQHRIRNGLET